MREKVLTKGKLKKETRGMTSASGKATQPPKLSPTTPYDLFILTVNRAKNLIIVHKEIHGKPGCPPILLADAPRASLVLSVSALDAYIRILVVRRVTDLIKDVRKPLPNELRKQLKELLNQDKLLDAARTGDLSSPVSRALTDKFEQSSFQGVRKITEAMQLLGKKDIFKDIARAASKNEQTLKDNVGRFTDRRHVIVHCGDYDLNQTPPIEKAITKKEAEDCIKLMHRIATEIEKVIKI
jgi:hypothetical protein